MLGMLRDLKLIWALSYGNLFSLLVLYFYDSLRSIEIPVPWLVKGKASMYYDIKHFKRTSFTTCV